MLRRSPLKRFKPLRRTAFRPRRQSVLRRTPIKRKAKPVTFHNGSAAGYRHMGNVKRSGCLICGRPAEAHHPLTMKRGSRASDYDCIALCFDHHSKQSPLPYGEAIHNGTKTFCEKYGSEPELLEKTRAQLRAMGVDDGAAASAMPG